MNCINVLLIYVIIIAVKIILSICDEDNIYELKEDIEIQINFKDSKEIKFYFDISNMKDNNQGVVTFNISENLLLQQCIKELNSKIIYNIDLAKIYNYFPFFIKDNQFPIESSFEYKNNKNFTNIHHLYFLNTNSTEQNEYLLIYINIDIDKYNDYYKTGETFSINIIPQIIIESFLQEETLKFNNVFSTKKNVPYYKLFPISENDYNANYLLYSTELFTITCGNLCIIKSDKKYSVNHNRHFSYFLEVTNFVKENQCDNIIIKYLSNETREMSYTTLSSFFPVHSLPLHLTYQTSYTISLDIDDSKPHFIIGKFDYSADISIHFYNQIIYGNSEISYKENFNLNSFNSPVIENEEEFELIDEQTLIEFPNNQISAFIIKCKNHCLISLNIFKVNLKEESFSILYSGIYYFKINNKKKFVIHFLYMSMFSVKIELINKGSVNCDLDYRNFTLDYNGVKKYKTLIDISGTLNEELAVLKLFTSSKNSTYIKIIVNSGEYYNTVPLNEKTIYKIGSKENTFKSYQFIIPKRYTVEAYEITIASLDSKDPKKPSPISFYSYFSFCESSYFITPSDYNSIPIFLNQPLFKKRIYIPNPYIKQNITKDFNEEKSYFYYIINFKDYYNTSRVLMLFNTVINYDYPHLPQQILNLVNSKKGLNYILEKSEVFEERTFMMINIFKCHKEPIAFNISTLLGKLIVKSKITNDLRNYILLEEEYGSDYLLTLNKNNKKFIFHHFYADFSIRYYNRNNNTDLYIEFIRKNAISIAFKSFYDNSDEIIEYYVYLIKADKNNLSDLCAFINSTPVNKFYTTISDGTDIKTEINNINPGKYWVNIVAHDYKKFKNYKIYKRAYFSIGIDLFLLKSILLILFIILSLTSLNLYLLLKKIKGYEEIHHKKKQMDILLQDK